MENTAVDVDLGYVRKCASRKLRSKYFVSKVGGCPVWLRLNNLPSKIACKTCDKPMTFLLQVYSPKKEMESAYHRTIFLFMCSNAKCHKQFEKSFLVYRSQLPSQNEFYSSQASEHIEKTSSDPSAEKYQPLCCICGCPASFKCSKCSEVGYCSKDHSDCDWDHKNICEKNTADAGAKRKRASNILLPEFEIYFKTEVLPSKRPEKSEDEKMEEYRKFMLSSPKEMQDMPLDDLDSVMIKSDKAFRKFQKRIRLNPKQVLRRYLRGGETPLWVSAQQVPSPTDIPDCACGEKRVFEFQIMPQLLNYLSLDSVEESIDWGTLAVYTCSKSCEKGVEGYVEEFVWKQDISDDL